MQALLRPKIRLLNLDIHQYPYSEWLIHSKRHLKRSLCFEFKENPLSHFSSRELLPKSEIGIPNLDFHPFCSERQFYPKWYLKRNYYMLFEENHSSRFFWDTHFRNLKLGYQVWISAIFSAVNDKPILNDVWKDIYFSWRKPLQPFLRYPLLVSFPVCPIPLPAFWISFKPGNIIYALVWYCV